MIAWWVYFSIYAAIAIGGMSLWTWRDSQMAAQSSAFVDWAWPVVMLVCLFWPAAVVITLVLFFLIRGERLIRYWRGEVSDEL